MEISIVKSLLLLMALGCTPALPEPPAPPKPIPVSCETACAHLAELKCEVSEPSQQCLEVCENSIVGSYDLSCVAGIASCDSLDSCQVSP